MNTMSSRGARLVAFCVLTALLASCGLPRSGPNKREIFAGSVLNEGNAYIVSVDDYVTRSTAVAPAFGFTQDFLSAGIVGSDTLRPGDTIGLTIWENVDDGLLAGQGTNATVLEEVQVDGSGYIFVPYAGRIKASGNTPEAIRRIITEKLEAQTPDPQVLVRRLAGDGATVSITGAVGAQGVYQIERPTRTLTAMLAQAGGVSIEPEVVQVTVFRGPHKATIWFQDLYQNASYDIALRNGDRILVEEDTRSFTAMGATGAQNQIPFKAQALSGIEALAQVGGLSTNAADPTGIFVFRNEPESIARTVLKRQDIHGPQRLVYVLDLTDPNGIFMARDFIVRDGDTLYVTEAPFVQWSKTLSALVGTLNTANTLNTAAGN